jgi:hypothetical protein
LKYALELLQKEVCSVNFMFCEAHTRFISKSRVKVHDKVALNLVLQSVAMFPTPIARPPPVIDSSPSTFDGARPLKKPRTTKPPEVASAALPLSPSKQAGLSQVLAPLVKEKPSVALPMTVEGLDAENDDHAVSTEPTNNPRKAVGPVNVL